MDDDDGFSKLNDKYLRLGSDEGTSPLQDEMTDAQLTNGHVNVNVQNLKAEKEKLEKKCSGEFHLMSKFDKTFDNLYKGREIKC